MRLKLVLASVLIVTPFAFAQTASIDLSKAVVVSPQGATTPERKAAEMLVDEIERRTYLRLPIVDQWPKDAPSVIAVGTNHTLSSPFRGRLDSSIEKLPKDADGYTVAVAKSPDKSGEVINLGHPVVVVVGADPRGTLFGVGRLLRELTMTKMSVTVPASLSITSAPKVPLRGHQLGYRPKVNTYDGWTPQMFEQYLRDLIVFGTNAFEMIPPRSDDAPDSPHFTLPQIDMMARLSQIAQDYDLKVWIWYPAMEKDYGDPATVEKEIKAWGEVFAKLPRIDAVLVPGGDPGHTEPKYLMPLLEKQTENLHRTHPNAQMWMSPQGFTKAWMDQWLDIMQKEQPKWLTGVAFAPQNRLSLPDMRAAVPKQYLIRHYPDITHSYSCQYPVQDWDIAYKLAEDREVINPRPMAYSQIFRWSLPYTDGGFISYSEGVNDDANKFLWSALGWDPDADVSGIMRQYARYFIGPQYEEDFANALLSLEKNWVGPLAKNTGVDDTLKLVQKMEDSGDPHVLLNWRFQQVEYRAYFDAYVRQRLAFETDLEHQAMEVLSHAKKDGALRAIDDADAILNRTKTEHVAPELRERVSNLAEALYQTIRMQLSVERYKAIDIGRGATFDMVDKPVNNKRWLETRFTEIKAMPKEADRLKAIDTIVNWTNPGPGGFYDDLGDPQNQPHLVRDVTKEFDPENRTNPLLGYDDMSPNRRVSWFDDAETRFEAPLTMRYENLDPKAQYKVRAVYAGDKWDTQMRLTANDIEVHGFIDKPKPIAPLEFDIPIEATAGGKLTLSWTQTPGRGSSGRGCQVAEVWLIRK